MLDDEELTAIESRAAALPGAVIHLPYRAHDVADVRGYCRGHLDARADAAELAQPVGGDVAALAAEVRRLNAELDRVCTNAGYGGYGGEAPEEMWLTAPKDMGCDAWAAWVERVNVVGGKLTPTMQAKVDAGILFPPVRYVRGDVAGRTGAAAEEVARAALAWQEARDDLADTEHYDPQMMELARVRLARLREALGAWEGAPTAGREANDGAVGE